MFLTELSPVFQELLRQPVAFSSGFFSGLLKLNISEEPLASWLAKQGYTPNSTINNDDNSRPKTISID
ncbi:MAG TPA: hypothetical protein ACFCUY_00360 [Xenococcaceae cyanobacterium]